MDAADEDVPLTALFTTITVSEDFSPADAASLGTSTVEATAYAVQSAQITIEQADSLAIEQFIPSGSVE